MDGQTKANQQACQKSGEGIKQTTVTTHNGISKLQYYHHLEIAACISNNLFKKSTACCKCMQSFTYKYKLNKTVKCICWDIVVNVSHLNFKSIFV